MEGCFGESERERERERERIRRDWGIGKKSLKSKKENMLRILNFKIPNNDNVFLFVY